MADLMEALRDNKDKVLEFVNEKYGELTEDEISTLKQDPTRVILIVEEKFGVPADQVQDQLLAYLGIGTEGLTNLRDPADKLLGGFRNNPQ